MNSGPRVVVFSDVDTILRARSFARATGAIQLLAAEGIPLVFCSSATRAEIEAVQHELGMRDPFVCENGSATFIPRRYFGRDIPHTRSVRGYDVVEFGRSYAAVVDALHRIADRVRVPVVGFSDMSVEQLARDCHLSLLRAQRAKLREYEEPFRPVEDTAANRTRLSKALQGGRLRCVSRGAFEHVGAPVDKSLGVTRLVECYATAWGRIVTMGLADAWADDTLLQLVDCPVVLQESDPDPREIDVAAWADAIVDGVRELRRQTESDAPSRRMVQIGRGAGLRAGPLGPEAE